MPKPNLNAKITITSAIPNDFENLSWNVVFSLIDLEGNFSGNTVEVGDMLFLDTSVEYPGTITRYRITSIESKSFVSLTCTVVFDDEIQEGFAKPDLGFVIGIDGTITRPSRFDFDIIPDNSSQLLPNKFSVFPFNKNWLSIEKFLSLPGSYNDSKSLIQEVDEKVSSLCVDDIVCLTQQEYDSLQEKNSRTLYLITDAAPDQPTNTPTPTSTLTATPTSTQVPTSTPTATPTSTLTATPTSTQVPTSTPTATPTSTLTATPTSTQVPTSTPTATPTSTLTATPTSTQVPTSTPTATPTSTQVPTSTSTATPTLTATSTPTLTATPTSTQVPTSTPTNTPTSTLTSTQISTNTPTSTPTNTPTLTSTPTLTATQQISISSIECSSLLMHMNGSANSTLFLDSSYNEYSFVSFGNAKITSNSKFGSGSAYFDGQSFIKTNSSEAQLIYDPIEKFTIEFWINPQENSSEGYIISNLNQDAIDPYIGQSGTWAVTLTEQYKIKFTCFHDNLLFTTVAESIVPLNTWTHVAISKHQLNSSLSIFINGNLGLYQSSIEPVSASLPSSPNNFGLSIGAKLEDENTGSNFYIGNLDEIRIIKGKGLYENNFVVRNVEFVDCYDWKKAQRSGCLVECNSTESDCLQAQNSNQEKFINLEYCDFLSNDLYDTLSSKFEIFNDEFVRIWWYTPVVDQIVIPTPTPTSTLTPTPTSTPTASGLSTTLTSTPTPTTTPTSTPISTNTPTSTPTSTPTESVPFVQNLFDKDSWSSVVAEPYLTYLNQAADRWSQYIKYNPSVFAAISSQTAGWNGLKLHSPASYSEINDSSSSTIASCGIIGAWDLVLGSSSVKLNATSFALTINKHFENSFTPSDWVDVLTHELGHALGIGILWHSSLAPNGAVPPSDNFLDGTAYTNCQSSYNSITSNSNYNQVPLESTGGSGTNSAHWENDYRPDSAPSSGGLDYPGLANELMVGFFFSGMNPIISDLSIKILVDFGYEEVDPGSNEGLPELVTGLSLVKQENLIKMDCCCNNNKMEILGKIYKDENNNYIALPNKSADIANITEFNSNKYLYVSQQDKIQIIDLSSNQIVGNISFESIQGGEQGGLRTMVLFNGKIFVAQNMNGLNNQGNSSYSLVAVIDPKDNTIVAKIPCVSCGNKLVNSISGYCDGPWHLSCSNYKIYAFHMFNGTLNNTSMIYPNTDVNQLRYDAENYWSKDVKSIVDLSNLEPWQMAVDSENEIGYIIGFFDQYCWVVDLRPEKGEALKTTIYLGPTSISGATGAGGQTILFDSNRNLVYILCSDRLIFINASTHSVINTIYVGSLNSGITGRELALNKSGGKLYFVTPFTHADGANILYEINIEDDQGAINPEVSRTIDLNGIISDIYDVNRIFYYDSTIVLSCRTGSPASSQIIGLYPNDFSIKYQIDLPGDYVGDVLYYTKTPPSQTPSSLVQNQYLFFQNSCGIVEYPLSELQNIDVNAPVEYNKNYLPGFGIVDQNNQPNLREEEIVNMCEYPGAVSQWDLYKNKDKSNFNIAYFTMTWFKQVINNLCSTYNMADSDPVDVGIRLEINDPNCGTYSLYAPFEYMLSPIGSLPTPTPTSTLTPTPSLTSTQTPTPTPTPTLTSTQQENSLISQVSTSNGSNHSIVGIGFKLDDNLSNSEYASIRNIININPSDWSKRTLSTNFVAGNNLNASSSKYGFVRDSGNNAANLAGFTTGSISANIEIVLSPSYVPNNGDELVVSFVFFGSDGSFPYMGELKWAWNGGWSPSLNNNLSWDATVGTFDELTSAINTGSIKIDDNSSKLVKSYVVDTSHNNWLETDIELKKGSILKITASGDSYWKIPSVELASPDGVEDKKFCQNLNCNIVKSACHMSLIGQIGDTEPFLIGSYCEKLVDSSGKLKLRVNDKCTLDNVGTYDVLIELVQTKDIEIINNFSSSEHLSLKDCKKSTEIINNFSSLSEPVNPSHTNTICNIICVNNDCETTFYEKYVNIRSYDDQQLRNEWFLCFDGYNIIDNEKIYDSNCTNDLPTSNNSNFYTNWNAYNWPIVKRLWKRTSQPGDSIDYDPSVFFGEFGRSSQLPGRCEQFSNLENSNSTYRTEIECDSSLPGCTIRSLDYDGPCFEIYNNNGNIELSVDFWPFTNPIIAPEIADQPITYTLYIYQLIEEPNGLLRSNKYVSDTVGGSRELSESEFTVNYDLLNQSDYGAPATIIIPLTSSLLQDLTTDKFVIKIIRGYYSKSIYYPLNVNGKQVLENYDEILEGLNCFEGSVPTSCLGWDISTNNITIPEPEKPNLITYSIEPYTYYYYNSPKCSILNVEIFPSVQTDLNQNNLFNGYDLIEIVVLYNNVTLTNKLDIDQYSNLLDYNSPSPSISYNQCQPGQYTGNFGSSFALDLNPIREILGTNCAITIAARGVTLCGDSSTQDAFYHGRNCGELKKYYSDWFYENNVAICPHFTCDTDCSNEPTEPRENKPIKYFSSYNNDINKFVVWDDTSGLGLNGEWRTTGCTLELSQANPPTSYSTEDLCFSGCGEKWTCDTTVRPYTECTLEELQDPFKSVGCSFERSDTTGKCYKYAWTAEERQAGEIIPPSDPESPDYFLNKSDCDYICSNDPTPTPSFTSTLTATPTLTKTLTNTPTQSSTSTSTPTPTPTLTPTLTPTNTLTSTPTTTPTLPLCEEGTSGGQGTTVTNHSFPSRETRIRFIYDAYGVPDRFIVEAGGVTYVDTGSISGSDTIYFCKPEGISEITVTVIGPSGTGWDYTICAEYNVPCPTGTPTPTLTSTPTKTLTSTPTSTQIPTSTPTSTPTLTATLTPTNTLTSPTLCENCQVALTAFGLITTESECAGLGGSWFGSDCGFPVSGCYDEEMKLVADKAFALGYAHILDEEYPVFGKYFKSELVSFTMYDNQPDYYGKDCSTAEQCSGWWVIGNCSGSPRVLGPYNSQIEADEAKGEVQPCSDIVLQGIPGCVCCPISPTITSTPTPTPTLTSTPTKTLTSTPTKTLTSTPTSTQDPTSTPTATPTLTATPTKTLTSTPTQTASSSYNPQNLRSLVSIEITP